MEEAISITLFSMLAALSCVAFVQLVHWTGLTNHGRRAILLCAFCLAPAVVFAQPEPTDPATTPFQWYTSVTGVAVATSLGVSILKRALGNVQGINAVPTWLFAVAISMGLTFLTARVWHTLPGPLWQNMWQAVVTAGTASGFYEWLNHATKPLERSANESADSRSAAATLRKTTL